MLTVLSSPFIPHSEDDLDQFKYVGFDCPMLTLRGKEKEVMIFRMGLN